MEVIYPSTEYFNPQAYVPYGLTIQQIESAMRDVIADLKLTHHLRISANLPPLLEVLSKGHYGSLVHDLLETYLAKFCPGLVRNTYNNGFPDLLPAGFYKNNSVRNGKKGMDIKATKNTLSASFGHSKKTGFFLVFRYKREPVFQFVGVYCAELLDDDWTVHDRHEGSGRCTTSVINKAGRPKLVENTIYEVPKTKKRQTRKEKPMRLDAIIEYNMDGMEAKAYKLYLYWLEKSRKIFPDYVHAKVRRGDPRKSLAFKNCYKVVRETCGDPPILEEKDYPLYVHAQLDILRHIAEQGNHPLIDSNCLIGEKAWKRWKLWKKKYDALTKVIANDPNVTATEAKAIDALQRTKEFIVKSYGDNPSYEKFQEAIINKNFFRWVNFGKISAYYLALSPYAAKALSDDDLKKLHFDPALYKPCLTPKVHAKFEELFGYEH